jgi:hypothetical protein
VERLGFRGIYVLNEGNKMLWEHFFVGTVFLVVMVFPIFMGEKAGKAS